MLVLLLLGLMLAKRYGLFEEKLHLLFQTESGVGLHRGMAVMLAGFRVGTLERVELGCDGAISGEIEVLAKHRQFLTTESELRVSKENLISSEIEVVRCRPAARRWPTARRSR
ncbi:MAG: MCE family protein [Candidatus Protistobacter heckmanni]|nr:MCE family protein [Candidatus Protistobacter heckmanni]